MAVQQNNGKSRFELTVDGHVAIAAYTLAGDIITFVHTEVPKELGGRGIGSQLARGALDMVRKKKLRVVARCPFIKAYIEKHAEYQDLLAG